MVGKLAAKSANVDWEKVNELTEKPRTYLIELDSGGIIFKMLKPSTAQHIGKQMKYRGWKSIKLVGIN